MPDKKEEENENRKSEETKKRNKRMEKIGLKPKFWVTLLREIYKRKSCVLYYMRKYKLEILFYLFPRNQKSA